MRIEADGTLSGPVSVEVVYLAFDDFEESKVKRDNEGKFAAQAGGGGSSAPTSTNVSSTITGIVKTAGYKKSSKPGEGGTAVYLHPSGAKVIVHPAPPGKKWSSKWTTVKPEAQGGTNWPHGMKGEGVQHGEGSSLASILKVAALMATQQEAKATKAATGPLKEASQLTPTEQQAAAAITSTIKGQAGPLLESKGYKAAFGAEGGDSIVFAKENGAKVQFNTKTNDWIATTPGFPGKEGNGVETLGKLLNGEKFYTLPGGGNSWNNTAKTIAQSPQEAAAKEAANAKFIEEQAKKKEAEKLKSQVLNTLIAHAPQPTEQEKSAVAAYSGSGYGAINTKLRHNPLEKPTPTIKAIDSFLMKASTPMEVTLYRKVDGEYAKVLLSSFAPGDSFIDRGFQSSSPNQGVWHGSLTMRIKAPAGSKASAIKHISHHPSEDEVLIARHSRYRVVAIDFETKTMDCELDQSHFEKAA